MEPTRKPSRVDTSGARVPVSLVASFVLCYLLIDSVSQHYWENAAIWAALMILAVYWLVAPEIRNHR